MSSKPRVIRLARSQDRRRERARATVTGAERFTPPGAPHTLAHYIERMCLSETLSLPLDAMTRRFAVLGQRDASRHAAAVLVEEMVSDRLPVAIVDTTGTWHGLRRAADGGQSGLPVQIFGGSQGGVELRDDSGRLVADCAVALAQPVLADLSSLPREAATAFVSDFVDQLRTRAPRAVHLVLDDAHALLGDRHRAANAGLLEVITAGSPSPIGVTLVTHRPRYLDRRVIALADALVVGRTSDRADQEVVWSWIEARVDRTTATQVVESLAWISTDEVWFCSPAWLGRCEPVTLRARATCAASFDRAWGPVAQTEPASRHLRRLRDRLGETSTAPAPAAPAERAGAEWGTMPGTPRTHARDLVDREARRGRPVARLVLTKDEKVALQQLVAQGGGAGAVAQHARIILACAEGRLNSDVARELGVTNQTVGRWRRRFVERRVDGLLREELPSAGGRASDPRLLAG